MSRLAWDATGNRKYETGVDHGVLWVFDPTKETYGKGVAWDGLTAVTESPSGGEETAVYADNIKYLSMMSAEEFGATIEAYSSPEEFDTCDGTEEIAPGVTITQQERSMFAFSYRSIVGNDTKGNSYGYKLHIIYGAKASPSERAHNTLNDSPEASALSWEVKTTPISVEGMKPTAHLEIDSVKVGSDKMAKIEAKLYGDADGESTLLTPAEIVEIVKGE